jgi:hypothetical protein
MEHLDIPEVKQTYDQRLQMMKNSGQVITAEAHQMVYEWACGSNMGKVQEKIQQGLLRQQNTDAPTGNEPTNKPRGGQPDAPKIPEPTEVYESHALSRLMQKHGTQDVRQALDAEFKRHGGWEAYATKHFMPKKEEPQT